MGIPTGWVAALYVRAAGSAPAHVFARPGVRFDRYNKLLVNELELAFRTPDRTQNQFALAEEQKTRFRAAMATAFDALEALRSDPDLPLRCRKAAKAVFSLEAGTNAYRKLYAEILGPADPTAATSAAARAAS